MRTLAMLMTLATVVLMTGRAEAQTVLEMPRPPMPVQADPETPLAELPMEAQVSVGDVAMYRYAGVRNYPFGTGPRFFQQYAYYTDYVPYRFSGFFGRWFLRPPTRFQFHRPFPIRGWRMRIR